jgi:uncharacterized protein with von Willebrand factor type A (vWA) domain
VTVSAPIAADAGMLPENVVHFGRVLRAAGLSIGPASVVQALADLQILGIKRRDDFRYALGAHFVRRREDIEIFDLAFELFWRDPFNVNGTNAAKSSAENEEDKKRLPERLKHALQDALQKRESRRQQQRNETVGIAVSQREEFQQRDFGSMTPEELAAAQRTLRKLTIPAAMIRTRRARTDPGGKQVDFRKTMAEAARKSNSIGKLRRKSAPLRPADIVVLSDHSGSMDRYTRILLHFVHALTGQRRGVHTFVFGTRLTNVTRLLRNRDPDTALDGVAQHVKDWAGGTRIAPALREFNLRWGRRLLSRGAVVLLITDGLDSGDVAELTHEMERLSKSCRFLVWLNPLLRFDGFEPQAPGIKAMLPHVDAFLPIHNLQSVRDIGDALREASGLA